MVNKESLTIRIYQGPLGIPNDMIPAQVRLKNGLDWPDDFTNSLKHPYQDLSFPGRSLSVNDRGKEWGYEPGWSLELAAAPQVNLYSNPIPSPDSFFLLGFLLLFFWRRKYV